MLHGSEDGILHIWGHSEEINRFGDWNNLKEAFEFINFLPRYEIKKNI